MTTARLSQLGEVPLLRADPALEGAIPPPYHFIAERALRAPALRLSAGFWEGRLPETSRHPFAFLILDGFVFDELTCHGVRAAQLLGAEDVLVPQATRDPELLVLNQRYRVHDRLVLAVLDDRFRALVRRWPELDDVLRARLATQLQRSAALGAILQLSRVEDRIVALLFQMAERWGRVTKDGVRVPIRLTHEMLGRLVGARRSTVTLALRQLTEDHRLSRGARGSWILRADGFGSDGVRAGEVAIGDGVSTASRRE
ncbi:MAG: helix-turn-helix domain-containing protein [Actinomycetota bacterium]|nr:helix-turn-helix domain-containing protein [Actinomycetota bacterium]